jgi:hypothetical protein
MAPRTDSEDYEAVMLGLDSLIRKRLGVASLEQRAPRYDADTSEETIASCLHAAKQLRQVRADFEDAVTEVVLPAHNPTPPEVP